MARSQVQIPGFSSARIRPECLRITDDGLVRVRLSVQPDKWFSMLTQLGELLWMARNPIAVMDRLDGFPRIVDWRNPVLPRDRLGLFLPNLAEHAQLWALRGTSPVGLVHGFEVWDASGTSCYRIILGRHARRDYFQQFVTRHQCPPEKAMTWYSPNHQWNTHRTRGIIARIPWLRRRCDSGKGDSIPVPPDFVVRVLQAASTSQVPIRTSLYSRGLICTSVWIPSGPSSRTIHDGSAPLFFQSHDVGLHLIPSAIASTWLWTGRCECCNDQRWVVEAGNAQDWLSLAINAADESAEAIWRDVVKSCL